MSVLCVCAHHKALLGRLRHQATVALPKHLPPPLPHACPSGVAGLPQLYLYLLAQRKKVLGGGAKPKAKSE